MIYGGFVSFLSWVYVTDKGSKKTPHSGGGRRGGGVGEGEKKGGFFLKQKCK